MYPQLAQYLADRRAEYARIDTARADRWGPLIEYLDERAQLGLPTRLHFICTHNSRRSQLAQAWTQLIAQALQWNNVTAFSGGTEATEVPAAVTDTLTAAGWRTVGEDGTIAYGDQTRQRIRLWSKRYDDPSSPTADFAAVLVCGEADKACPVVPGAGLRLPLPFDDPKVADGTPEAAAVYAARSRDICRELLFVFERAKGLV